ncbi:hypothetical protein [Streptomyces venezuelae]|uniref:hypothetical protein n=1 Tax=Streptomyces venezuelae TaxID=54571 RepID=UPI00278C0417|nr:hypothetical protein [Streptomyces venezuelae]
MVRHTSTFSPAEQPNAAEPSFDCQGFQPAGRWAVFCGTTPEASARPRSSTPGIRGAAGGAAFAGACGSSVPPSGHSRYGVL